MNPLVLWAARVLASGILAFAGLQKLIGASESIELFTALGMEPSGRAIIGLIELVAALLLLSPQASIGALLAMSVMLGAIIAHATVIGVGSGRDGWLQLVMLVAVFGASFLVLFARRSELPLVGSTLDERVDATED